MADELFPPEVVERLVEVLSDMPVDLSTDDMLPETDDERALREEFHREG
jgi:hypothetical protein